MGARLLNDGEVQVGCSFLPNRITVRLDDSQKGPTVQKVALVLAILGGLASSGCVLSQTTDGSPMSHGTLTSIEPGVSTRQDVSRELGPPDEIVYSNRDHDPLFAKVFIYDRPRTRTTGTFLLLFATHKSDTKFDRVTVFFDENGIVEDIGSRLEGEESSYGMPW